MSQGSQGTEVLSQSSNGTAPLSQGSQGTARSKSRSPRKSTTRSRLPITPSHGLVRQKGFYIGNYKGLRAKINDSTRLPIHYYSNDGTSLTKNGIPCLQDGTPIKSRSTNVTKRTSFSR